MRSLLFTPAHKPDFFVKGLNSQSTGIIIDLEDGVGDSLKTMARQSLLAFDWSSVDTHQKTIALRINTTPDEFARDLEMLESMTWMPQQIILPKTEDVTYIKALVEFLQRKKISTTKIFPMVESVIGLTDMKAWIPPYLSWIETICFGAADFCLETSLEGTWENLSFYRHQLCYGAFYFNIPVYDSPYFDIKNQEGLRSETLASKAMGFSGKLCIHPTQCEMVSTTFGYTQAQYEDALNVKTIFEKNGRQAIKIDGKMIDEPFYKKSLHIIQNYQAHS